MTLAEVDSRVAELTRLRRQNNYWRTGATALLTLIALWAVLSLNGSARGLAEAGPRQDQFVALVKDDLQKNTLPTVQAVAQSTFAQMQPSISHEFTKFNKRLPELTKATMKELDILQQDLPTEGSKVLDDQFGSVLKSREEKVKAMFPGESQDQLTAFEQSFQKQGHDQILVVNTELLSPHRLKIQSIIASMQTIKSAEAANVKTVDPNWEMGLALLDVMKDDLTSLRPDKPSPTGTSKTSAATAGKDGVKK